MTEIKTGNKFYNNYNSARPVNSIKYSKHNMSYVWDKELKEGEFRILYNFFYFLSKKIDNYRGIKSSNSVAPTTNLRFLVNIYQFIAHVLILFFVLWMIYLVMKIRYFYRSHTN